MTPDTIPGRAMRHLQERLPRASEWRNPSAHPRLAARLANLDATYDESAAFIKSHRPTRNGDALRFWSDDLPRAHVLNALLSRGDRDVAQVHRDLDLPRDKVYQYLQRWGVLFRSSRHMVRELPPLKEPAHRDEYLKVAEAAARVGCSRAVVRTWIAKGRVRTYRYGRMIFVPAADIDAIAHTYVPRGQRRRAPPGFVTVAQAAARLKCSLSAVYGAMRFGRLPRLRVDGAFVLPEDAIREYGRLRRHLRGVRNARRRLAEIHERTMAHGTRGGT